MNFSAPKTVPDYKFRRKHKNTNMQHKITDKKKAKNERRVKKNVIEFGRWTRKKEKETDRLTQQWGIERVVLLVVMGTQDTFDLHIRGHKRGRRHLWKKLLPRLLSSPPELTQVQCIRNVNANI